MQLASNSSAAARPPAGWVVHARARERSVSPRDAGPICHVRYAWRWKGAAWHMGVGRSPAAARGRAGVAVADVRAHGAMHTPTARACMRRAMDDLVKHGCCWPCTRRGKGGSILAPARSWTKKMNL